MGILPCCYHSFGLWALFIFVLSYFYFVFYCMYTWGITQFFVIFECSFYVCSTLFDVVLYLNCDFDVCFTCFSMLAPKIGLGSNTGLLHLTFQRHFEGGEWSSRFEIIIISRAVWLFFLQYSRLLSLYYISLASTIQRVGSTTIFQITSTGYLGSHIQDIYHGG